MNTFKRPLEDIAADFSRFKENREPIRTRQLVRLMDELESNYGTFKARNYTEEEVERPENQLYIAISSARR